MNMKIMIGVFSYNEGYNLSNIVKQLFSQTTDLHATIVLMDESDDPNSLKIVQGLISEYHLRHYGDWHSRMGKVPTMNILFQRFLESNCEILLHFDADQILHDDCVTSMLSGLESGFDVVAALSLCLPGRNLFERGIRITLRPGEMLRQQPYYPYPLLGHNGGYSRRAVSEIYPLPETGADEELYILHTAMCKGIKCAVIPSAKVSFRTASNITEYVSSGRRVIGSVKSFIDGRFDIKSDINPRLNCDNSEYSREKLHLNIYRRPPFSFILRAMMEDPLASLALPFILIIREALLLSSKPYASNLWEIVNGSKDLRQLPK